MTGFNHRYLSQISDIIVNAIKRGDIKQFFYIGGCDGSESERNYYKQLAKNLPQDHMILTPGCAKFRFNKFDIGYLETVDPNDSSQTIPLLRILNMGQCNDTINAFKIANALAKEFGTNDLNELPLHLAVSWMEQKAVAIFLSVLHLGLKNVRIGPGLPAFLTPSTLDFLVKNFNLQPVNSKDWDQDYKDMI
jgi:hydroxylamine reductase